MAFLQHVRLCRQRRRNGVAPGRNRSRGEWWTKNNEIHSVEVDGPYVNGDQFVVHYKMDFTPKQDGGRQTVDEVGVYTVHDDKITEERFFPS